MLGRTRLVRLCQDILDDLAVHISQAEIASLMPECQLLVINAQAMQDRGIKIMDMNRILGHVIAKIIGLAINDSRLNTATRHPLGVTTGVMIASVIRFG